MRSWRFRLLASLLMAVAVAAMLGLKSVQQLEVIRDHPPRVLLRARLHQATTFTMSFRHSVEGIRVRGTFAVAEDGRIRVTSTSYPSYGAGLEKLRYGPTTRIEKMTMTWFPPDMTFPELIFRITAAEDFRFRMGHHDLALSELVPNSSRVRIRARRLSLLRVIGGAVKARLRE